MTSRSNFYDNLNNNNSTRNRNDSNNNNNAVRPRWPHHNPTVYRSVSMEVARTMQPPPGVPLAMTATSLGSSASQYSLHTKEDSTSPAWRLRQVPPVPLFHPIPGHALKLQHLPLDHITFRISEFMRLHSIETSYQDQGRVVCTTWNLVKFAIQLWQASEVILEVSRIQGDAMEHQQIKQELVRYLQRPLGQDSLPPPVKPPTTSPFPSLPRSVPRPNQAANSPAIDICQQMLQSKDYQQRRLGLESLVVLTDSNYTDYSLVDQVSHLVVFDTQWQQLLIPYFPHHRMTSSDENIDGDAALGDASAGGQLLALKVLVHALERVGRHNKESGATPTVDTTQSFFWRAVVPILETNISLPEQTLEASASIRCLRFLQQMAPPTSDLQIGRVIPLVQVAHQYGRRHHLGLERETQQLLEAVPGMAF